MRGIDELILAYLGGEASDEDVARLFEWVRKSPENAKEFARTCALHGQLREQISGQRNATVVLGHHPAETTRQSVSRSSRPRLRISVVAIAASLLLVIGLWISRSTETDPVSRRLFATVVQAASAKLGSEELRVGDRLSSDTIRLESGIAKLQFDDGVVVSLKAPAELQLIALGEADLRKGTLAATVPPGAEGFTVTTPTAQVVDLGTAFGVELDAQGVSHVAVFDGEVEVVPLLSQQKKLLKEGSAVQVLDSSTMEPSKFDRTPFEKLWPVASGIKQSTGAFEFAPPWPLRMSQVKSDEVIFVLPEGYSQALSEPLQVDVRNPGTYRTEDSLVDAEIPVGTRIQSFLLQFNPVGQTDAQLRPGMGPRGRGGVRDIRRMTGAITFDRPVLGVIVRTSKLDRSDSRFSRTRDANISRQLELWDTPISDEFTLSEDRHTIRLKLVSVGIRYDHMRVIVDAGLELKLASMDSKQTTTHTNQ